MRHDSATTYAYNDDGTLKLDLTQVEYEHHNTHNRMTKTKDAPGNATKTTHTDSGNVMVAYNDDALGRPP